MKKLFFLVIAAMFGMTAGINANAATSSVMSASAVAASSSSSDWDKVLDSYEKYVNEYIAVYKKVQAGDASAYSQLASLMEKYQKLDKASGELTASQLARLQKINVKLAKAIQ